MDNALISLTGASIAFVGAHFAMSHPLRPAMLKLLGANGFQAVYSLIIFAAIGWMYFAFTAAGAPTFPLWQGYDDISWAIASILALIGMVLFAGSATPRNPAMALPGASKAAAAKPAGIFKVTRHPMMWGFALWASAHMIAAPTARTLIVATSVIVMALVGAHLQDRKKRAIMGEAWAQWESRTHYWPRWSQILSAGAVPWMIGIILWAALSWLHSPIAGIDAGLWRWIG